MKQFIHRIFKPKNFVLITKNSSLFNYLFLLKSKIIIEMLVNNLFS